MIPIQDTEAYFPGPTAIPAAPNGGSASPATGVKAPQHADHPLAEFTPVAASEARRVLTRMNLAIAKGLTLWPIPVGFVGAAGLLIAGCYYAGEGAAVVAPLMFGGILWGLSFVAILVCYQKLLASYYLRFVARRAFARRTSPLVRFGDEGAEFLEVIPRGAWQGPSIEPANDIGLWRIDRTRGEFLFEGDVKRYRIPLAAVTSCELEEIRLAGDETGKDLHFAVVLQVETTDGEREIPLFTRHLELSPRRASGRRRQAEGLCRRIQEALA